MIKSEQNKVDFKKKDEIDEGLIKEYEQRNMKDRKYNLRSRTKMYSMCMQEKKESKRAGYEDARTFRAKVTQY